MISKEEALQKSAITVPLIILFTKVWLGMSSRLEFSTAVSDRVQPCHVMSCHQVSDKGRRCSVSSPLDHGVVRELQVTSASFQRARDAVAHLEVGAADVGRQRHLEVRARGVTFEPARDDGVAVALVLHLGFGRVLLDPADLDDLAGGAAPPRLFQQPVGDERRLGPPFVGKQQDACWVTMVIEDLAAALPSRLVIKQLHHFQSARSKEEKKSRSLFMLSTGNDVSEKVISF